MHTSSIASLANRNDGLFAQTDISTLNQPLLANWEYLALANQEVEGVAIHMGNEYEG